MAWLQVVTRRAKLTLSQKQARQHIVSGFLLAVDHLDAVVALIRAAADGKAAKAQLIEKYEFSDDQAEAILNLSLRRLTGLAIGELRKEDGELTTAIGRLQGLLKDEVCPRCTPVLLLARHRCRSHGCAVQVEQPCCVRSAGFYAIAPCAALQPLAGALRRRRSVERSLRLCLCVRDRRSAHTPRHQPHLPYSELKQTHPHGARHTARRQYASRPM